MTALHARLCWRAASIVALAASAAAQHWYVDAAIGNNLYSGTSPFTPWRTITWAVAHVPSSGVRIIHVAGGTYDPALGEVFPIRMRPGVQLIGATSGARAHLTAHGAMQSKLVEFATDSHDPQPFDGSSRLEHLRLTQAAVGIRLQADAGEVSPVLFDLVIERMRDVGIQVDGIDSAPLLDRVQIAGSTDNTTGGVGLLVSTDSGAPPTLVARDCVFSHNATYGLQVAGGSRTRFERCRFQGNGSDAASLAATTTSATRVELADCLIANNDYAGLRLFATLPSSTLVVRVERCTIAGNGAEGIVGALASSSSLLELDQAVVFGHAADLAVSGTVAPTRSLIGDGSFAGVNGCFAADPLFVQPSAGDFRVKWSSPCIDAAWVATPAGALDLLRHPRDVDGDLDTSEIDDLGAFEFRPLELVGSGALGTLLTWESWGPKANLSTILWTSGQLPFTPTSTPFGEYDLTSLTTSVFRVTTVGASAPTSFQRIVPPDPLMVGQTFSFQALTDNALAPNGKAYTNLVRVTIAP